MLKIAICDDDVKLAGWLESQVNTECLTSGIRADIDIFYDGLPLVKNFENGKDYDIIFLDIEMENMDGISTARNIRKFSKDVILIYISGYDNYLKELFEVEPFRFLSKPVNIDKFKLYFNQALGKLEENEGYFQYIYKREFIKVPIKNIAYFESSSRLVHIHLSDGTVRQFYGKINDIEKNIDSNRFFFLRIHQSFLINYKYVKRISYSYVIMHVGNEEVELKISEKKQKEIRDKVCNIAVAQSKFESSGCPNHKNH
ncbi:MAG: response regulator transcription factor [Butyrivibrio sp.]|nr:response regulator transcription factor [Butyrivibrio sp.]